MGKAVLIIDDDEAFRELLRGVFEQADYKVHCASDGASGLSILEAEIVDLVVMDQRLPGGESGAQLLERFAEKAYKMPVIVVSGYLTDDAIRAFIREGVDGIFLKPLNIFSLLKRANALTAGLGETTGEEAVTEAIGLGGLFGHSAAGKAFLQRAQEVANFRRNLLLVGPAGMPFETITRDLERLSEVARQPVLLRPTEIVPEKLAQALPEGDGPFTLTILDAERLSASEVDRLIDLADARSGATGDVRIVLVLRESGEVLYDTEVIDEVFYMFLGTNELRIPSLREMPEDLIEWVKQLLAEHSVETVLDTRTRSFLTHQEWEGNLEQLRTVVMRAMELASPGLPGLAHFEAAMAQPVKDHDLTSLRGFLGRERERYLDACHRLGI